MQAQRESATSKASASLPPAMAKLHGVDTYTRERDSDRLNKAILSFAETCLAWKSSSSSCTHLAGEEFNALAGSLRKFEPATIGPASRAWHHWVEWRLLPLQGKGLNPLADATSEAVHAFCVSQEPLMGPGSMYHRMAFLAKQGGAPIQLPTKPTCMSAERVAHAEEQGVVVEPVMMRKLEALAPALRDNEDWRLGAVYGAAYIARSSVRYEHMQRSCLVSRSGAAVWAECYRGKAGTSRRSVAFRHCAPRVSLDQTKRDILDDFWSMWNRFKASNPGLSALVLDARTGLPM